MSQYLILLYEDESFYAQATPDVLDGVMQAHNRFAEQVTGLGAKILAGNALQPTSTATSLRRNAAGVVEVTDGPFVETKEALGGFYLLEADDLDAAVGLAKQVPAPFGGLEVRPVMVFD